ncbi:MAG TPA: mRNA surveillance protein pelota [Thermoplasmata archaeon]|nr:mRNA surveillance protein pelota [Thermoplasmata archaeon]
MRLLLHDRTTGTVKLRLETPSDLWRLARLVQPGERVGASTTRRDPEAPEDVPGAERSRRRVYLVVRVEQVEFHGFSQHVRVIGPIVEGPFDIGRHHTLDLTEGDDVTLQKPQLSVADQALLDEGVAGRGDPTILIAAVDWGDSSLVRVRGRAIEPVADVRRTLAGKRYDAGQGEKDRSSYLEELRQLVEREGASATAVLLAGPGFLKEALARRLAETAPELARRTRVYPTAEAGRVGVDELLRSGRASEVLRSSVAAEEAEVVEQLVRAVASGTRAAVGRREVAEALDGGAVAVLLVSDRLLAEEPIVRLLDRSRAARARLFVVRAEEAPGRRLAALGEIAAILRYDWTSAGAPTGSPEPPRGTPRGGASGP